MEGDPRNPRVSLLKKYDIPIDHLSYEYVEKCTNTKELERIIRILRSGEEGSYPDLLKVTEEQLRKYAPDSRVLRVVQPILTKESLTNEEWSSVEKELLSWENEMNEMDKSLDFEKSRINEVGNKNAPAVRKVVQQTVKEEHKKTKVQINHQNERIKSGDYDSWEKFDVEKELLKLDIEEQRKEEENKKKKREAKKLIKVKDVDIESGDKENYSIVEQQVLSTQAKDRGNECYKSGDYQKAKKYYDISINFYESANAFNNRAMTYLKLKQYEKAVEDCNKVLSLEKNNVKALHRRATAYQNLSNENSDKETHYNELALDDLIKVVNLEPNNKTAQSDLQKLKVKLNIKDTGKKFRLNIQESCQESVESNKKIVDTEKNSTWNTKNDYTSIEKLPLTYYGPSTSTFQCDPYSITHHALWGSSIPGQVMCKCNSNRTKQNPLCQKCGEAMCRPPTKAKPKKETVSNQKKTNETQNQALEETSNKTKIVENARNEISPSKNFELNKTEKSVLGNLEINVMSKAEVNKKNEAVENKPDSLIGENQTQLENVDTTFNKEIENFKSKIENNIVINNKKLAESNSSNSTSAENEVDLKENSENLKVLTESSNINNNLNLDKSNTLMKETLKSLVMNSNDNTKNKKNESETIALDSGQCSVNNSSKKSKNKKKNSKEAGDTKIRKHVEMKPPEPVKIVHAAKYVHSTSVEPKTKSEKSKEPPQLQSSSLNDSNYCKFKEFVPNKKCLSVDSEMFARLSSTPSANKSLEVNASKALKNILEGNKENIMESNSREINDRVKAPCGGTQKESVGAFEFMKTWEEMKKSDESFTKRAELIRMVKPSEIGKLIGINLDYEMLSCLLECLTRHFVENDPKVVIEILKQLPQLPRFGLISMFLNDKDKKTMSKLIETAEAKGFKLDEDVKRVLKTNS